MMPLSFMSVVLVIIMAMFMCLLLSVRRRGTCSGGGCAGARIT